MKNTMFVLLLLVLLSTACTKTTQDTESSWDIPVVESFLAPGQQALIGLSTVIPYTTDTTAVLDNTLSGLLVYIHADEDTYLLTEPEDSAGFYRDQSGALAIKEGQAYSLEFQYKDKEISSTTVVPLKPENFITSATSIEMDRITEAGGFGPPDVTQIELSWDNESGDYYLIYIQYLEDDYDTINTMFDIEDAATVANFSSDPISTNFFNLQSRQFHFFGEYQIVLCKITQPYAQLYESLNQSSLEGLTEPPTNVTNGKGVFASYNSDTLSLYILED